MYIYCLRLFKRSNCKARFYSPLSSSCIQFVLCIMRRNKGQITSIYKCQLGSVSAQFQYARITNSTYFISSFHIRFIILIYGQQRIFIFYWSKILLSPTLHFTCKQQPNFISPTSLQYWTWYLRYMRSFDRNMTWRNGLRRILLCNLRMQKWIIDLDFHLHFRSGMFNLYTFFKSDPKLKWITFLSFRNPFP